MNRYTIPCTKEQTIKALELGAPIILESEYYTPTENDIKLDKPIPCESYTCGYHYAKCPTTEQMIGWLEDQGLHISIIYDDCTYKPEVRDMHDGFINKEEYFGSHKKATLAAIDVALGYLINNK